MTEQLVSEEVVINYKKQKIATELFQTLTNKTLKGLVSNFSRSEIRFLVNSYYQIQDDRIRTNNQIRRLNKETNSNNDETEEIINDGFVKPDNYLLGFLSERYTDTELMIKQAAVYFTDNHPVGVWLKSIHGIGPVIAAGLLAHIDILKAPTAGHIWSFAGLDPNVVWEKGKKRPFNADLKKLAWKIGVSFMKQSSSPKCDYGHIYLKRKEYEVARNESGGNKALVEADLARNKYSKDTEAYKHLLSGKLPPAQIQMRAQRYAVKIFLSHLQQVWWEWETGEKAPKPFAIAILGHAHMIEPHKPITPKKIATV